MRQALSLLLLLAPALAFAQNAAAPGDTLASSQYASLLPLVLIFFIFYFLLIRPQQKRMKEHQAMLAAVVKGDEVVTSGGIVGRITKVDAGDTLTVEIAKGVEVSVVKSTISRVLGKTDTKPMTMVEKKKGANKNDNRVPSRDSIANDN